MTYATLLPETGIDEQFLCVLKPKKHQTGWTVVSGFEYKSTFDKSDYITVTVDGTAYTLAGASSPLSVGEYFYDTSTDELFINTGNDPNTAVTVVVQYELFFATTDAYIGRDPTDTSSATVHYEGLITRAPQIKQSVSDNLLGFLPTDSSSISFANGFRTLEGHLYDISFSKASIVVYHALRRDSSRDFDEADVKKIIDGVTDDVSYDESSVNMKIRSKLNQFDTEYRNVGSNSFFDSTTFPSLDPNFEGQVLRFGYGWNTGVKPVNIDFKEDSPTTSDNRDWVVLGTQTGLTNITRTVGSGSTTTTIEVGDATGIRAGDFVYINKSVDEYREVVSVDYAGNSFDVTPALSSGAPVASDTVERKWVARVEVERDGVRYKCFPVRDYNVATFAGTTSGFSFTTSMESNTGLPSVLTPSDLVFCTIYGKVNDVTVDVGAGPVPLGADSVDLGVLTNPIVILYDLLVNKLGLPAASFDKPTFQTLAASTTEEVGLMIPKTSTDTFPTFKDLLSQFVTTVLFRFYVDNSDLWTLSLVAPVGAATDTLTNDEIFEGSFKYTFDYKDVASDITVRYRFREVNSIAGRSDADAQVVTATSDTARYLHEIEKTQEVDSLHFESDDAQTLANRRAYIFGDRLGTIEFTTKDNAFFDSLISDVITTQRAALPGFNFDEETLRSRSLSVTRTTKDLKSTSIALDDQKGIEDADDLGLW